MIPQLFEKVQLQIIKFPPEILTNIARAVQESKSISIVTEAHVNKGSFYIKKYKQLKKEIKLRWDADVEGLKKKVKAINADYKAIINAFDFEPERLGSELTALIKKKRELEEVDRKKEQEELDEALIKEAEIFDDESVLDATQGIQIKRQRLDTEHLTTTRSKKWRIIDEDKIPRKYFVLNEVLINKIRKEDDFDAKSSIDGIEYYMEERPRL